MSVPAGARLWTLSDLPIIPRVALNFPEQAVYSGTNLSSMTATGVDAGAMTIVAGPPTQGTPLNGVLPTTFLNITMRLEKTLSAWGSSGRGSIFAFAKPLAFTGTNTCRSLVSRGWYPGSADSTWNTGMVCYAGFSPNSGPYNNWNRDHVIGGVPPDVNHGPEFAAQGAGQVSMFPDTTNCHSAYVQAGTTDRYFSDGAEITPLSSDVPAAVPNYPSSTWAFCQGIPDTNGGAEGLDADLFYLALFDDWLGAATIDFLEGYWFWQTAQASVLPSTHTWKNEPPWIYTSTPVWSDQSSIIRARQFNSLGRKQVYG